MIDIGCNLSHPKLRKGDPDLTRLVADCKKHGVERLVAIGTDLEDSKAAIRLTERYPGFVNATVGIHPHDAKDIKAEDWQEFKALLKNPEVVAIGEMGLDFCRNYSPQPVQLEVFEKQLQLNEAIRKPLYLHERDATDQQVALLTRYRDKFPAGVAHCFTGGSITVKRYLDLDLYIGITGWICDERRNQDLLEAVPFIPNDRLLVETDCPFLLPRTLSPKPKDRVCRPWHVQQVLEELAAIRNTSFEALRELTTENAVRFLA